MISWEEDASGRRWERWTVSSEHIGLQELDYHALRMLEEGNAIGSERLPEPAWEAARPALLERGYVRQLDDFWTASYRNVYVVTDAGLEALHKVGSFRRLVPARQPFRLRPMSGHWTEAAILATLAAVVAAVAYQVFR